MYGSITRQIRELKEWIPPPRAYMIFKWPNNGVEEIKSTSLYSNYDQMIIVDDKMDKAGIVLSLSTRDRSVGPVTWYREHFNEIP